MYCKHQCYLAKVEPWKNWKSSLSIRRKVSHIFRFDIGIYLPCYLFICIIILVLEIKQDCSNGNQRYKCFPTIIGAHALEQIENLRYNSNFSDTNLAIYQIVQHNWPRIFSVGCNHNPALSWSITGVATRGTRRVSHVEQELSSPPGFSRVRVVQSSVFCVVFCRSLFVLLYFFFCPLCCLS